MQPPGSMFNVWLGCRYRTLFLGQHAATLFTATPVHLYFFFSFFHSLHSFSSFLSNPTSLLRPSSGHLRQHGADYAGDTGCTRLASVLHSCRSTHWRLDWVQCSVQSVDTPVQIQAVLEPCCRASQRPRPQREHRPFHTNRTLPQQQPAKFRPDAHTAQPIDPQSLLVGKSMIHEANKTSLEIARCPNGPGQAPQS